MTEKEKEHEELIKAVAALSKEWASNFELNDGWSISSVLIGIDYPRRRMVLSA